MSAKRPLAVFCIAQHEPVFLPRWLRHYAAQVPPRDIYVLHHALPNDAWSPAAAAVAAMQQPGTPSAGRSDPARMPINVVPVHHATSFDHDWLRETVARFQAFLLQSYDWTLFAEADEIVCCPPPYLRPPHGRPPTLPEFLAREGAGRLAVETFRATGYEVVHDRYAEPALDQAAPLWLPQRSRWCRSKLYSKPTLSRVPLRWTKGFHQIEHFGEAAHAAEPRGPHPDLLLVHLHKVDFDIALARSRENAARPWSEPDKYVGAGMQNRIVTEAEMNAFFAGNVDDHGATPAPLEDIPDAWRTLC